MKISEQSLRLLKTLHESLAFREALAELVQHEIQTRTGYLRTAARDGNSVKAAMIEGEITAYEELAATIMRHANRIKD